MGMNNRELGSRWEQYAAEYLEKNGYLILENNYRCRYGEIDIIAQKRNKEQYEIIFVEVKYRSNRQYGTAMEAVGKRKQETIRKVAQHFLIMHHYDQKYPCSFDVIAIDQGELTHLKNAF